MGTTPEGIVETVGLNTTYVVLRVRVKSVDSGGTVVGGKCLLLDGARRCGWYAETLTFGSGVDTGPWSWIRALSPVLVCLSVRLRRGTCLSSLVFLRRCLVAILCRIGLYRHRGAGRGLVGTDVVQARLVMQSAVANPMVDPPQTKRSILSIIPRIITALTPTDHPSYIRFFCQIEISI